MFDPLTVEELKKLISMAVSQHDLDPYDTYVEFTWWDEKFKPLICTDCNFQQSEYILVFGEECCNTWSIKRDRMTIPCGFYIFNEAVRVENVVHRPLKLASLTNTMDQFKYVKFMLAGSPVNSKVNINPFRTRVYKNLENETILAFYAEDRDNGEWLPFSRMKPENIVLIKG